MITGNVNEIKLTKVEGICWKTREFLVCEWQKV
jgi:hypothetical protein